MSRTVISTLFVASLLAGLVASARAGDDSGPRSAEVVRLHYWLGRLENSQASDEERQELLARAQQECRRAATRSYARSQLKDEVLNAFQASYGENGNSGLPLSVVTSVESALPGIFGPNNERLTSWLNQPAPPSAWRNSTFRRFLQDHLEQAGASALHTDVGAQRPRDQVIRWGFLATVAAGERGRFVSALENWCQNASASAMPPIVGPENNPALGELESALGSDFTLRSRLEGLLADRLFALPVPDWDQAAGSLLPLCRDHPQGVDAFFKKASDFLYTQRTDPAALRVLITLTANVDAANAFNEWLGAEPRRSNVEWFQWLHQPGLLQLVHHNNAQTVDTSLELLKRFSTPAEQYPRLHDLTVNYYYGLRQQQVFDSLLRPYARGPHTKLILNEALAGKFDWKHRETLGLDLLDPVLIGQSAAMTPAWPGGDSRLKTACTLFCGLPNNSQSKPEFSELADSPLLDRIADELIKLVRQNKPAIDTVVDLFDPVASMLAANRPPNDTGTDSKPLHNLEHELANTILDTLASLSQPSADGSLSAEAGEKVDSFVGLTRLCLRLNALIRKAAGRAPEWLAQVRHGVAEKVFGLNSDLAEPAVLDWPENMRSFRARVLLRLDGPLSECLSGEQEEAQKWWREIYLPLVRVKSLLATLRNLAPPGTRPWPHLAWVEQTNGANTSPPAALNSDRLDDMFEMLHTNEWLDAFGPAGEAARLDLTRLNSSPELIWNINPEQLFSKKWSVNAGWLLWKNLLDSAPPIAGQAWKLEAITQKITGELKSLPDLKLTNAPDASTYVSWALNVLAAAEWQRSPFLNASGEPLPCEGRLTPSGDNSRPFAMRIEGTTEASRRIRSDLRMALINEVLIPNLVGTSAPADRVNNLIEAVIYLVNSPDNHDPSDTVALDAAHLARQNAYAIANLRFQAAGDFDERFHWLRQLMLLHASNRKQTPLEPAFPDLLEHELKNADNTSVNGEKLVGLKQELIKLQDLADDSSDESPEGNRRRLGQELHALVPDNLLNNPVLMRRNWRERLAAVDENEVERQLELLAEFQTILKQETSSSENPESRAASDLELLGLALTYVDFHINFSRPDFEGATLLGPTQTARIKISEGHWQDNGSWWPAISVLSWCNQTLKTNLELAANALLTATNNTKMESAKRALNKLTLSNEAQFLTLSAAVENAQRDKILNFKHDIEIRLHNFRLLAESIRTVRTSSETLTADSFQGVLQNLRLIIKATPERSDALVQARFFQDLAAGAPSHLRRAEFVLPNADATPPPRLCLDMLAQRYALWIADAGIPAPVRTGAEEFSSTLRQGPFPLFSGGATPAGVTAALSGIFSRIRSGTAVGGGSPEAVRRYADFYKAILMDAPNKNAHAQISGQLYRDLAEVMFRTWEKPSTNQVNDIVRQRKDFAGLIEWWRKDLQKFPEPQSSVLHAVQDEFGDPLARLLRGDGREANTPYLWQPADELDHAMHDLGGQLDGTEALAQAVSARITEARLNQAPDQFLELTKWFFSLQQPTDPSPLLALFDASEQNPGTAAATRPHSQTQ